MDGGSRDNTLSILGKYLPWFKYCTSGKDDGQEAAINAGLCYATGTWVNWLNSDDYLLPGALHAVADCAATLHLTIPSATGI